MPEPATVDDFLELVRRSGVVSPSDLKAFLRRQGGAGALAREPRKIAEILVLDELLTPFQAEQFLRGRWRGFTIGQYKVLQAIGSGGMGDVYLCEHLSDHRRLAVKVLPPEQAKDALNLQRFYREARIVTALHHPNLVRAFETGQDGDLHFLVMDYINGPSMQEMVTKNGPLPFAQAADYMRQAALGLQYFHQAGLVHRDIKPSNILVDRKGVVKILDMGLARFFQDGQGLTQQFDDKSVLGTADYLSPEQARSSSEVDIRSDIYSLGITFYFLLVGRPPFADGRVAQKLLWHQLKAPQPIRELRPEVPENLAAVLHKMLAKEPAERHQTPAALAEALAPWGQSPAASTSDTLHAEDEPFAPLLNMMEAAASLEETPRPELHTIKENVAGTTEKISPPPAAPTVFGRAARPVAKGGRKRRLAVVAAG
jgi:serine/threonine protein kinase